MLGSISPSTLNGNAVGGAWWTGGIFSFTVYGWVPQNEFATLTVSDSLIGSQTFNSASAAFVHSFSLSAAHITIWTWVTAQLFADGGTYHLPVT